MNIVLGLIGGRSKDFEKTKPPRNIYYLKPHQVRRMIFALNTTVSYTTRFATFFYNWYSFSPETKMGKIGITSPVTGKEMDIGKRWLHFAELGFVFNLHS